MTPASDNAIDAQLLDLMLRAGSRWVLWLLLGLSLAAIAILFDRLWFFWKERAPKDRLASALATLRSAGAAAALGKLQGAASMPAVVARACLAAAADGPAAVEEIRAATIEAERIRYERRLAFLGTLGNNAPFVGLFGTVLGIIRSVHDLGASASQDLHEVMAGISQALVATGVGLLVALPAVAAYNAFIRHVETTVSSADTLAHQILAYLRIAAPAAAPAAVAEVVEAKQDIDAAHAKEP
jgi:biopolymer transport protein ExbB